jgi:hypothetical protein
MLVRRQAVGECKAAELVGAQKARRGGVVCSKWEECQSGQTRRSSTVLRFVLSRVDLCRRCGARYASCSKAASSSLEAAEPYDGRETP